MSDLPTEEELSKLTRRGLVAYAARCAQRVEPLYCLEIEDEKYVAAIHLVIQLSIEYAQGKNASDAAKKNAYANTVNAAAAAYATGSETAHNTADAAANAYNAAFAAADAGSAAAKTVSAASRAVVAACGIEFADDVRVAERLDFEELLRSAVGVGEGEPIDFAQLGPLWPGRKPDWFTKGSKRRQEILGNEHQDVRPDAYSLLVVDDEPVNQLVIKRFLKDQGYEITTVSTGQEAIDICTYRKLDVILMDVMMPSIDGIEATREIRTNTRSKNQRTPILALSANPVHDAMCLEAGINGVLRKPLSPEELLNSLANTRDSLKLDSTYEPEVSPPAVVFIWDADAVDEDKYADVFEAVGDVVRASGGLGLKVLKDQPFGVSMKGAPVQ